MIRIARMVRDDVPAVVEIEQECHPEPWSGESFLNELKQTYAQAFVARLATGDGKAVEASGEPIVGYVCSWLIAGEIQILNLCVHRAFRRLGIARRLMLRALQPLLEDEAGAAVLEVRQSNRAARQLYESLGFRPVGIRPHYYEVIKEPAILMRLEPDSPAELSLTLGSGTD